jgi:HEAT repeat protein
MAYDPAKKEEPKSIFGVIVHSFFVVPFLLAIFSVLLFTAVRILTMEKHTVYDYLEDVKNGGLTKRWQAAFELSRTLSNKGAVPTDEKFVAAMVSAFEKSKTDDEKVRQYLVLAMGRSGNQNFVEPLLKSIAEEKDENLHAFITSLGILGNRKATDALLKCLNDDNPRIRLATVIALGNIGDPIAVEPLKAMLNDPEPNVAWDAAVSLSKMGDASAKGLLMNLMSREYLDKFPNVNPQAQTKIMLVAIEAISQWSDPDIKAVLQKLFETDKNMNVRALAHKVLEKQNKI